MKKSARNAKRAFAEELAGEAKHAAARGEMSAVYKTTKRLCGKNISLSAPVKDKNNNNLTTALEQAARWVEHFGEVLNPLNQMILLTIHQQEMFSTSTSVPLLKLRSGVPSKTRRAKSGKAAGIDSIHPEMLKRDLGTSTKVLTDLLKDIWEIDTKPYDWTKDLIVKSPKKGNPQSCDNWTKDNAAREDIKARLGKDCGAFALQPVWRSKQYSLRTKL